MAASGLVDTGFLVGLLSRRDAHHRWAVEQAARVPRPWFTCEAVLSEAVRLLPGDGASKLASLIRRSTVVCSFRFDADSEAVLRLLEKYAELPMSFADACLVRMTETLNDPLVLTTDTDFRVYRRHGRQVVPCVLPR